MNRTLLYLGFSCQQRLKVFGVYYSLLVGWAQLLPLFVSLPIKAKKDTDLLQILLLFLLSPQNPRWPHFVIISPSFSFLFFFYLIHPPIAFQNLELLHHPHVKSDITFTYIPQPPLPHPTRPDPPDHGLIILRLTI